MDEVHINPVPVALNLQKKKPERVAEAELNPVQLALENRKKNR